ncbi:ABC transporter permease subunit [Testudinibacter sp. TR-2022]|uniref:PhnE/PtxC family ABC transporter permease n=1 Tax=Testudinibacter sp. TR-2022 TaxID=2585029 RepID=UPI0011190087|nr:ABC transporter permease subunit [Testudinibacter sp. TR-2022]TNH03931.1 ABC transporter permease subunit [Pasteurellaceae bacterium Phil31]TNH07659.1 ABC transporter permease subunit [Testudinibacter sp. TR-2022]TNH09865.1 ABC transporter permease subunit [Testudinibacter sp. TR-2022]TNH17289.1 ABC transporter permease subunit [Testudinibacter sp. TR-2022]TNH18303.1 ABC transporter permease subunit [Testudinibacter sp. TR-2022]
MDKLLQHFDRHFIRYSFWAVLGLIVWSWLYILKDQPNALFDLFRAENWHYLVEFIEGMLGVGEETPAYLDPEMWQKALVLTWQTFVMSILATGIAAIAMFILVLPSARNVAQGKLGFPARWYHKVAYHISRFFFLFSRAVPELMWAMILVFIFKPGIVPGALALAIHNFGVLGKLCGEVIEDMDEKPIRHLAQNGASPLQILLYGIYPTVMPRFLNYILYRMENIIRATLIVGFVGASGLGMQFKLAMSFFHYSEITLYLLCYLLLVYVTDFLSAWAKRYLAAKD